jgi:hypothetical protein
MPSFFASDVLGNSRILNETLPNHLFSLIGIPLIVVEREIIPLNPYGPHSIPSE